MAEIKSARSDDQSDGKDDGNATKKPYVHRVTYDDPEFFVNYMDCLMPYPWYMPLAEVESFEAKSGDICLISYPRSGKNWMSAIVLMILNDANPDCLHSKSQSLTEMCPFLEECVRTAIDNPAERTILKIKAAAPPRLYATHLTAQVLPVSILQKTKVIYTVRNPKDVVVSMQNCLLGLNAVAYKHDLPYLVGEMVKEKGRICYGPYFNHIEGYWKLREVDNLLFCSFEQLKKNMKAEVARIAVFLGKDFTEVQLEVICRECSFHYMKDNPTANRSEMQDRYGVMDFKVSPYMREGKSGGWKNKIDEESNKKMDDWIGRNLTKPELEGLQLDFD